MFIIKKILIKTSQISINNRLFKTQNNIISYNFTFGLNFSTRYQGSADGTLQARILKYFQTNRKNPNNTYELLNNAKNNSRSQLLRQLKKLDNFHCENYEKYSISDIFAILSNIMLVTPAEITKLKLYENTMNQINFNKLTQNERIEYIFYLSLDKRKRNTLSKWLNCLNQDKLNVEDLAILCVSTFKRSIKFEQKHIFDSINSIFVNTKDIYQDPGLLIVFIKSMRLNNYCNQRLLEDISKRFQNDNIMNSYSFTGLSHIIALFANCSFFQREFIVKLYQRCMEDLKNQTMVKSTTDHFSKQIRAKDISRFLWALSYLGFDKLDSDLEGIVVTQILQRIELGEFKTGELIDTVLSLWILNIKSEELIHKSLTKQNVTTIQDSPLNKDKARLYLLITCIQLEANNYIDKLELDHIKNVIPKITFPNYYRKSVRKVHEIVANLTKSYNNIESKHFHQIPNINIDGISLYKNNKKIIDLEILDDFLCLRNLSESVPNGLMKLKLRLLQSEEDTTIEQISKKIVNDDNCLYQLLEKLISSKVNTER